MSYATIAPRCMSIILAVEAAHNEFSAALSINGEIQQYRAKTIPNSMEALPLARRLLSEAQITLKQCDAFAFDAGPGKFSGLRLGCGIIQSFAYANDRPGIGVCSMAALAQANYKKTVRSRVEAVLSANRGHIFAAHCRYQQYWQSPRPRLLSVDKYHPRARHVCGQGFITYPHLLPKPPTHFSQTALYPDAAAVCAVAVAMLAAGQTLTAMECAPLYVNHQVAQTIAARKAMRLSN